MIGTKLLCPAVVVVCGLMVVGCRQEPAPAIKAPPVNVGAIKKEIDAHGVRFAESLAKAPDLEAFRKAFEERFNLDQEVRYRMEELPPADQVEVMEKLNVRVDGAIDAFHNRMIDGSNNPKVVIDTSFGPVKVELYETLAPITVKNFLRYVDDRFYDGTIFHRVIPNFMIQGGGFEPGMQEKPTYGTIKNESYNLLKNLRGTLAMARTPRPDSASAQFFINIPNNGSLDRANAEDGVGYAVFGKVIDGMDVVDRIQSVPTTTRNGHKAVPETDVLIKTVRRVDEKSGK